MSKQMLILDTSCPQCAALLTEGNWIRLHAFVRESHEEGEMRLSALFGNYAIETEMNVSDGACVEFHCPCCDASILLPLACKLCAAPMASLHLVKGGYIEFCTRRGCKGHAIGGLGDIDQMMSLMNRMFETPYD